MRGLALLLVLLLPAGLFAQDPPPVVPPAPAVVPLVTIEGPTGSVLVGRLFRLSIKSNGRQTEYALLADDADIFREYDPDAQVITLRGQSYKPGKISIVANTAIGDVPSKPALYTFDVVDPAPPVPPAPPTPPVPPVVPIPVVPAPSADLAAILAPVKSLPSFLAAPASSRAKLAEAWTDCSITLAVKPPPGTSSAFKAYLTDFFNAAATKAGLVGAFPGYTAVTDQAFASYFGPEDVQLDPAKAKAFVSGLVWAAQ